MCSTKLNMFRQSLLLGVALLLGLPGLARAVVSSLDFASLPPTTVVNSNNSTPLVMLLLGKDDSLYKKAYTDLVDLTGDGKINTTYTDSFTYYGYFNSNMCYTYDVTNGYFVASVATAGGGTHYCPTASNYWSGNFLNWATMTRIDVLRKVLYGGYRSTDTATQTVLERAYFPPDAHSFAKVYKGADMDQLTPYPQSVFGAITICNTTDVPNTGLITNSTTTGSAGTAVLSQNVTAPPLMRVAAGDFSKWAANERWQCTWAGEKTDPAVVTANTPNNNDPSQSLQVITTTTSSGATITTYQGGIVDSNGGGPDYNVRVQVCDGVHNGTDCTQYPNNDYKPTGLLQIYGQTGKINFGLMTGSYTKSKSGGLLRKNISTFANEVNYATDGTFTNVSGIVTTLNALRVHGYDYNSGLNNNGVNGDNYLAGTYNTNDNCPWGLSSFTEPNCSNWGNPMSEMYLEAVRYFKGLSASTAFNVNDSTYLPPILGTNDVGLSTAAWTAPLNANNWCAKCSIIVLNSGPFSYDSDQIDPGFANLTTSTTAEALTDQIGGWENITGNSFFIGNNGTTNDGLCTAKVISNLSTAIGPCPDEPRLGGSFDMAGIAYWAHITNLNSNSPSGHSQTINTYTVNLSSTTPIINIKVPGSTTQIVKLMPACQNEWSTTSTTPPGDCRLVDMQIIKPYTLDSTGTTASGTIYVNWEDSEQGGDFDQDMRGTIDYTITATAIDITTNVDYRSTSFPMGFGYVLSGTGVTTDGFHVHSGIYDYTYTDPNPGTFVPDPSITPTQTEFNCNATTSISGKGCVYTDPASTYEYALSTTSTVAGTLEDPLWYTAKYGGFFDDGTHLISSSAQWDDRNNVTGAYGADGTPDNYFTSTDPGRLATNLNTVMADITQRVSSGTATAVIANSGTGTGMLVQALYQPQVINKANPTQQVTWVGMLHSLFLDSHNNLREDGNQNRQLDDYVTDPVVSISYNPTTNETVLNRYSTTDGVNLTLSSTVPLDNLKPIWSARDQLAALDNIDITSQRNPYAATINPAATGPGYGRYIFTAIDNNNDGVINALDVVPFTAATFDSTSTNYGWLDIQNNLNAAAGIDYTDADDLVNFIRGEENIPNTAFRSRTIDYDQDNIDEVWRLGDIIHSTPLIVGPPASVWDNKYADNTYTQFRTAYANRRVVVYTGANDGMLHAFDGGFFDPINKKYCRVPLDPTTNTCPTPDNGDPLGSELWAYVPSNLLPHLQWLAEQNYPHVYYVDGSPQAFDVNIFDPTTGILANSGITDNMSHPDGWGTILVVGMRLGGSPITYTPVPGRTVTSRSAFMIFDITDPEQAPVLLGEISDPPQNSATPASGPILGFTTSKPSLLVKRAPGTAGDWTTPSVNDWYLVFGSGPNVLKTATSTRDPGLYILNLKTMGFVSGFAPLDLHTNPNGVAPLPPANSFVGNTNSVDWTNNFSYDAAYFGIVGGGTGDPTSTAPSAPTGQLMRLVTNGSTPSTSSWIASTVINPSPSQPFVNKPVTASDDKGKWWIYAGTGRLFVPDDNLSTGLQSLYGIKEQVSSTADSSTGASLPSSSSLATRTSTAGSYYLQDTTGVQVYPDRSLTDPNGVLPAITPAITTFDALEQYIETTAGWYIDFPAPPGTPGPSTRNLGAATMFRQLTVFTSYTPSADSCLAEGSSTLYAVYYKTGTAYPNAGLGTPQKICSTCTLSPTPISVDLGIGLTRGGVVVNGDSGGIVLTSSSTGAVTGTGITGVPTTTGRQTWRQIILQ